jgi:oxygen-independent coproporphyrinogen-3 oxidase
MTDAGYVYIGMDHFAKPDDELAVAQRQGRLHRNFQGYSTHSPTVTCWPSASRRSARSAPPTART